MNSLDYVDKTDGEPLGRKQGRINEGDAFKVWRTDRFFPAKEGADPSLMVQYFI